jgi:DNA-binding transcriptional LysR family regulator
MSHMQKFNIKGLELNSLIVFEAIMKKLSVTGAADELGVNQPNVSYALKRLREAFGDELFIRTSRGLQPTAKAIELMDPIARMIGILRNEVLTPPPFDPEKTTRNFVINSTDLGEITFIPSILKYFREWSSRLSLESVCLAPQELMDAMREGKVDLAIGYYPEMNARTVYSQELDKHPMVCLARTGHPYTANGLTLDAYSRAEHVGLVGEGHSQRRLEERIADSGINRRVAFRSQNFTSIPYIVRDTDLIATVPKMLAVAFSETSGLQVFRPPFPIEDIPIKQYWTDRQRNDPGQVWLRRVIAEMFMRKDPSAEVDFW